MELRWGQACHVKRCLTIRSRLGFERLVNVPQDTLKDLAGPLLYGDPLRALHLELVRQRHRCQEDGLLRGGLRVFRSRLKSFDTLADRIGEPLELVLAR